MIRYGTNVFVKCWNPMSDRQLIRDKVAETLELAKSLYGVDFGKVLVSFDLKSKNIALAVRRMTQFGVRYEVRFNPAAMVTNMEDMLVSTVPHEIAHLVAWERPDLKAREHNRAWAAIARSLGDPLPRAITANYAGMVRGITQTRYRYENDNGSILVTKSQHMKVKSGAYCLTCPESGEFRWEHFVKVESIRA